MARRAVLVVQGTAATHHVAVYRSGINNTHKRCLSSGTSPAKHSSMHAMSMHTVSSYHILYTACGHGMHMHMSYHILYTACGHGMHMHMRFCVYLL